MGLFMIAPAALILALFFLVFFNLVFAILSINWLVNLFYKNY